MFGCRSGQGVDREQEGAHKVAVCEKHKEEACCILHPHHFGTHYASFSIAELLPGRVRRILGPDLS